MKWLILLLSVNCFAANTFYNPVDIKSTLTVTGNATTATLNNTSLATMGSLSVSGNSTLATLSTSGNASLASLNVSGNSSLATMSATGLISGSSMTLSVPLNSTSGGTGQSTYTNGQILIGNSSTGSLNKSTLTAGSNITITNGAGAITIASTSGGNISSDSTGSLRVEYALVSAAGVVSNETSDWINGDASLSDTSLYSFTLNSGFSSTPVCFGNTTDTTNFDAYLVINPNSSTTITARTGNHLPGVAQVRNAEEFSMVCIGPR